MKLKKFIIATMTFSFLILNMGVISANADEAEETEEIAEYCEETSEEFIDDEEINSDDNSNKENTSEDEDALEDESLSEDDTSLENEESLEDVNSLEEDNSLADDELLEDDKEKEDEENHPCSITITTVTTVDMCTSDHEIVSTETEIMNLQLDSEETLTLDEASDLIFSGYEDDDLLANERKAFRNLDLPEDCPESLEIKFYVSGDGSLNKVKVL